MGKTTAGRCGFVPAEPDFVGLSPKASAGPFDFALAAARAALWANGERGREPSLVPGPYSWKTASENLLLVVSSTLMVWRAVSVGTTELRLPVRPASVMMK